MRSQGIANWSNNKVSLYRYQTGKILKSEVTATAFRDIWKGALSHITSRYVNYYTILESKNKIKNIHTLFLAIPLIGRLFSI